MVILPEMVGSVVGIHNGKTFNAVEIKVFFLLFFFKSKIKPEMIGHYIGEFAITYKWGAHGRAGIGATRSSRFVPLK
jgi:small subunit ribosomal protein S15e